MKRFFYLLPLFLALNANASTPIDDLQKVLNDALDDDRPITLVLGTDLESGAGTVVFLSRQEGTKRMVALARSGKPELAVIFFPRWNAWLVESKVRLSDNTYNDIVYSEAGVASGSEVEMWHTHNNVTDEPVSREELRKRSIQWTMPSPQDLLRLYNYSKDYPAGKLSGIIASTLGITRYWNDTPNWAQAQYIRYAVQTEAKVLSRDIREKRLYQLRKFARDHEGFIKLSFSRYPP